MKEPFGLFLFCKKKLDEQRAQKTLLCDTLMKRLLTTFKLSHSGAPALSSLDPSSSSSTTGTSSFLRAMRTRLPFLSYKPTVNDDEEPAAKSASTFSHSKCSNILGILNFLDSVFRYLNRCTSEDLCQCAINAMIQP